MKKKILCILLALFLLPVTACGGDKGSTGGGGGDDGVEKTNKKLWSASAQVVVTPDEPDALTEMAADEFADLFEQATELSVTMAKESNVTNDKDALYYYIGDTDAVNDAKIDHSYATLGDSGIVLKTVENVTYIAGATGKGHVYAVYEFMHRYFGYEFYAGDEVYIGDGSDANVLKFDITYRPSIANPCLMAGELNYDESLYYKYRFQNYYQTWMAKNNDPNQVYYAHTYFKIMPKSKYQAAHPDWYSKDGENLCLTRGGDELVQEFANNVKEVIETDDEHRYFMMGQEDNFGFCDCDSCKARREQLGGYASGVMMEFTNKVVRILNAWLKAEKPDRNITFVTFAYNETKEPPVTYNEETKKYEPVSATVVAEPNISVQYVINMCDYYAPYSASRSIVRALDGWSALSDSITIWEYSTNFNNYIDCFDNFNSMAQNLQLLESHGVDYIVEQAAYNTATTAFSELRLYLWSKLMWNNKLDTKELIEDFMYAYYQDVAEDMIGYFDTLYSHVDTLVAEHGVSVRSGGDECMKKEYWPNAKFTELKAYFNSMYETIEAYKDTQAVRYRKMHDRIEKQELWVDYYRYKFYPTRLEEDPDEFFAAWRKTARKYGMTLIQEGLAI